MVVYSPFPVVIDGVSLDSVAWNIESKVRQIGGLRSADVAIPGVDGEVASLNDDLEATLFSLNMWLLGTNGSGLIPLGSAMTQCRDNLDQLMFLFRKRHALLNVTEVVDGGSTMRQCYAKVVDSIQPEIRAGGVGRFAVNLKVPDGMWQDPATSDWTQTGIVSGNYVEVASLQGSTEHIADSIILVTGPATNPQITDSTTGAFCRLNATVPAGSAWRLNSGTWSTRYGAGLTLGSLDSAGTDAQAATIPGGGKTQFLRLVPALSTGLRRVQVSVTGTGFTSATAVSVRARRKYSQ